MSKNDPAFPVVNTELGYDQANGEYFSLVTSHGGLTKREWFAAMVMQGLCADPSSHTLFKSPKEAAESAVEIADAFLSELERTDD